MHGTRLGGREEGDRLIEPPHRPHDESDAGLFYPIIFRYPRPPGKRLHHPGPRNTRANLMHVAIIGGGITGLATALSLHAAGIACTVFEAVEKPAPLGVGINLLPHAMREMTELGLLAELEATGVAIDELVYRTRNGRDVWNEPRGLAAGYRWPQIAIHRGELQMLLIRAVQARLGPDAIRFGWALIGFETGDTGTTAHYRTPDGGASFAADVLAGCDGIHSAVRRRFFPDEGLPKWNGVSLFRSTVRTGKWLGGRSMLWAGHARQKFVGYPIAFDPDTGDTLLNFICDLKTAEAGADTVGLELAPSGHRLSAKLSGSVGADARLVRYTRRVDDPQLVAGYALKAILERSGVKVSGEVKLGSGGKGTVLARHESDPLSTLLYALGMLCERESLWGKAQTYLEASLALEDQWRARVALGELHARLGHDDLANMHLAAALKALVEQQK